MVGRFSIARTLYRWIAVTAIPGTLWSAFEMYVLTLGGAQMLFSSIVHTMWFLVIVVLVGVVALALWALQSIAALILKGYGVKLALPAKILGMFAVISIGHLGLLFSYEFWSVSGLRIAVCLLGLVGMSALLVLFIRHLWARREAHAST